MKLTAGLEVVIRGSPELGRGTLVCTSYACDPSYRWMVDFLDDGFGNGPATFSVLVEDLMLVSPLVLLAEASED